MCTISRRSTGSDSITANIVRNVTKSVIYPAPDRQRPRPRPKDQQRQRYSFVIDGVIVPALRIRRRRVELGMTKLACQAVFVISFSPLVASGTRAVVQCCTKAPHRPDRLTPSLTAAMQRLREGS